MHQPPGWALDAAAACSSRHAEVVCGTAVVGDTHRGCGQPQYLAGARAAWAAQALWGRPAAPPGRLWGRLHTSIYGWVYVAVARPFVAAGCVRAVAVTSSHGSEWVIFVRLRERASVAGLLVCFNHVLRFHSCIAACPVRPRGRQACLPCPSADEGLPGRSALRGAAAPAVVGACGQQARYGPCFARPCFVGAAGSCGPACQMD